MKTHLQDSRHLIYEGYFGKKLFIDRVNENIILEDHFLFFFPRQRVIPFKSVARAVVDYKPPSFSQRSRTPAKWVLSLDIAGGRVKIDDSERESEMWSLAQRISELIGKEMTYSRGTKEALYDPKVTREEIVEKWRKRAEQEAEERKKQKK